MDNPGGDWHFWVGGGEFLGVEFQPCRFFLRLITVGEKPTGKELVGMVKLNLL